MSVLPVQFVSCTLTLCIHWYIAVLISTFSCKLEKKKFPIVLLSYVVYSKAHGSTNTGLSYNTVARHGPASVAHWDNATIQNV